MCSSDLVDANDGTNVYVPPGNTKPVWTTDQIIQQLVRDGATWGPVGQAQTITYSFYTSLSQFPVGYGSGELTGFSAFTNRSGSSSSLRPPQRSPSRWRRKMPRTLTPLPKSIFRKATGNARSH